MLSNDWEDAERTDLVCHVCGKRVAGVGWAIGVCPECIVGRWDESRRCIEAIHAESREAFGLPLQPPASPDGLLCNLCTHRCRMRPAESGYCGIRSGARESLRRDGRSRGRVSYYYDPLPTNCVADWVCPGGTGAGYPDFAHERGPEAGYYNLAVFFEACNFNCLFCQNWSFKKSNDVDQGWRPPEILTQAITEKTSCICYFGGDPTPQIAYAVEVARRARRKNPDQILRICWETNGSVNPVWLKQMVRLSLESGGCIKVDLKAWNPQIHRALCGCDNRQVLENFVEMAKVTALRPDPPLLVASTLLVPGYVGEEEVRQLASFIARCNPDIPYTLLAFAPQFYMDDFPTTSREQVEACLEAARQAGLQRVHLGNRHLVGASN
jgi:pyruvate formate lyase activating enzyme